jgi:hypothetical protein
VILCHWTEPRYLLGIVLHGGLAPTGRSTSPGVANVARHAAPDNPCARGPAAKAGPIDLEREFLSHFWRSEMVLSNWNEHTQG